RAWAVAGFPLDTTTLALVTGTGLLFWAVTLSQALESVTRVYYGRADLDLILSSPASSRRVFAVRAAAVAFTTFLLGALLISPLVTVLAIAGGPAWLSAYLVLAGLASLSVALAMLLTFLLFRLVGPRRTRFIAQVIAAIIGAGFIIGIQAVAILSHEGFSRLALFQSADFLAAAPPPDSLVWLPARAATGQVWAALGLAALGLALL